MAQAELLAGEVAVVTGGASGNGRAMARQFADEGADIVVADIVEQPREGGRPTAELIAAETDVNATYVDCDVTDVAAIQDAIDAADAFGGVTIMVNNAGITESQDFLATTEAEFDRMMDINVKGAFFGAQRAAASMLEDDRPGVIINISSTSGLRGRGDGVRYCTSKGGVRLMTYALADALAPDIRVNAIHPDYTETAMIKDDIELVGTDAGQSYIDEQILLGRAGQPGDVADAAVYLASDMSSYVTGHSLVVDGGVTATK